MRRSTIRPFRERRVVTQRGGVVKGGEFSGYLVGFSFSVECSSFRTTAGNEGCCFDDAAAAGLRVAESGESSLNKGPNIA